MNRIPRQANQTLDLLWTPSISPGVAYTAIYVATNSETSPQFIQTNNFTGSSGVLSNLPWCRLYLFDQAVTSNGIGSVIAFGISFSGWGEQPFIALQSCTNLLQPQWQDIYRSTNLNLPAAYFRTAIGKTKIPLP
jgi:hypothetical protein